MKTDAQLQHDVLESLRWEPAVTEKGIGVTVTSGVVTLRGSVPAYGEKYAASQAAERVKGVRGVAQELEVALPGEFERSDGDLARSAANLLDWDLFVPKDRIKVRAERGFLTLDGTVDTVFEKDTAEAAVRNLVGVRAVTNLIIVSPSTATPAVIRADIEAALERDARLDAERIDIETSEHTVTLRGTVHSLEERREAERAAWAAPGIRRVENLLTVETGGDDDDTGGADADY